MAEGSITPPRPVIGQTNKNGGPITSYDQADWDKLYGSQAKADQGFANQSGASIYGTPLEQQGELAARKNAQLYYGSSNELGQSAADYRDRLKSKVNQPSALANQMTQSANQQIARSNAKAGMAGVDTSARSIASQRDAQVRADAAQQASDQVNLANYGKSIGAGISGTESLAAAGAGKGAAATPTPTTSYGGGIFSQLGSIICTELFVQKKLSLKELSGCRSFGENVSEEVYLGYLTIAKPIVALMKRSDKFSNLFIGWAKSISMNQPNRFTRIMIPICGVIGKLKVEAYHARQS